MSATVTDVAVYESYDTTKAKQQANRSYADMVGVKQQLKIIKILTVIAIIFGIASAISSSFGFYYDFIQILAGYTIGASIVLGITIEILKIVTMWGAFADWNGNVIIKGAFVVLLILFTTLALVLHYRGLTNYETVTVKDTIAQVRDDALKITKQREARADKLTDLNVKTVKTVLNNGTAYDDGLVVKSMSENNKMIASLKSTGVLSEVDLLYIEQQKKSAKTMKKALGIVFPIIELLAVLGIFIMFLKKYSTSEGVREFISNREKMNDMEANYFDMVNQTMRDDFMRKMRETYSNHGYGSNQFQDKEFQANQFQAKEIGNTQQPTDTVLLEERFKRFKDDPADECMEEDEYIDADIYTTIDKERVRALDYKLFNEEERAALLVMYDNGHILPGEHLVKRTAVVAELKAKIKNIGEVLTNLNGKLQDNDHIKASPRGYIAKSALSKELWQEKED